MQSRRSEIARESVIDSPLSSATSSISKIKTESGNADFSLRHLGFVAFYRQGLIDWLDIILSPLRLRSPLIPCKGTGACFFFPSSTLIIGLDQGAGPIDKKKSFVSRDGRQFGKETNRRRKSLHTSIKLYNEKMEGHWDSISQMDGNSPSQSRLAMSGGKMRWSRETFFSRSCSTAAVASSIFFFNLSNRRFSPSCYKKETCQTYPSEDKCPANIKRMTAQQRQSSFLSLMPAAGPTATCVRHVFFFFFCLFDCIPI